MGLDKFGGEDDQASSDDVVKAIEDLGNRR